MPFNAVHKFGIPALRIRHSGVRHSGPAFGIPVFGIPACSRVGVSMADDAQIVRERQKYLFV